MVQSDTPSAPRRRQWFFRGIAGLPSMSGVLEIIVMVSIILGVYDGIGDGAIFMHPTEERVLGRKFREEPEIPVHAVKLVDTGHRNEYDAQPHKFCVQSRPRAAGGPTLKYGGSVHVTDHPVSKSRCHSRRHFLKKPIMVSLCPLICLCAPEKPLFNHFCRWVGWMLTALLGWAACAFSLCLRLPHGPSHAFSIS